jgi:hypothetical protein
MKIRELLVREGEIGGLSGLATTSTMVSSGYSISILDGDVGSD